MSTASGKPPRLPPVATPGAVEGFLEHTPFEVLSTHTTSDSSGGALSPVYAQPAMNLPSTMAPSSRSAPATAFVSDPAECPLAGSDAVPSSPAAARASVGIVLSALRPNASRNWMRSDFDCIT
eukprot:CAMPEP_0205906978 /NCGR_PEP_ID=MMETSP1325-20131115/2256_1 /ASSEMBLY_ACC=CAM_ASM_000708 /TAXON_ID=236786 /ORGANISM="Florenciella sp., Strain RCC1007" /LENGTH=122 /DNA_ID=CAMNT_0053273035 /DNA_START=440 /DNA_END=808 /DNA_ORIENTATION=-